METKTIEVDGIETSYMEEGSGQPVLFEARNRPALSVG